MPELTDHLRLLGDENRLRLLHLLAEEPLTVAELQEVLELSQSSVSGHLGKLKRAGYLHDHAEGSAHRYRLREDLVDPAAACWASIRPLSSSIAAIRDDRDRLAALRSKRGLSWIERVAGHLHREYAPGRSWDALGHAFLATARLGDCIDIGAGDGAMAELLAASCDSLVCIDPSPIMVAAGQRRIAEAALTHVSYREAPGEALPLPDACADTILFLQSIQYIADPATALAEAIRCLRPGGRLCCLTLAKHDYAEAERYGHRHRGFSPRQLTTWLQQCSQVRCLPLAAEAKPPRFTPLLLTAIKDPR